MNTEPTSICLLLQDCKAAMSVSNDLLKVAAELQNDYAARLADVQQSNCYKIGSMHAERNQAK